MRRIFFRLQECRPLVSEGTSSAIVSHSHRHASSAQPAPLPSRLSLLVSAVSTKRAQLQADDIYKLCALLSDKDDILKLRDNSSFVQSIADQRHALDAESLSPFQISFIDSALSKLNVTASSTNNRSTTGSSSSSSSTDGASAGAGSSEVTIRDTNGQPNQAGGVACASSSSAATTPQTGIGEVTVQERIAAIWSIVDESRSDGFVGTDDMKRLAVHCSALESQMRQLNAPQMSNLVKALATVNYQDYSFTTLLSRRCSELASQFEPKDACRTYFNLVKLNSHDSLVALVNQLDAHAGTMNEEQVFLVAQALERQQQISAAPMRLVPKLASRAVAVLPDVKSSSFHRAMLVALSRYNLRRHPTSFAILADLERIGDGIHERDLLRILQAAVNLNIPATESSFAFLLKRIEGTIATMDVRNIDALVDILSVCECDTTPVMDAILLRLSDDAGKLTLPQLTFLFEMLSSYPPAQGSPATASMAFAASLRSESMDGESLQRIIIAMAHLKHFTDEFYTLADTLVSNRGGIRTVEALRELLEFLDKSVADDPRGQSIISRSIFLLAPVLNDEEIHALRKDLTRLGVNDRNIHQKLFGRVKQLQREAGSRRHRGRGKQDDFIGDF